MDVRNILSVPFVYDLFQWLIGNKKRHKILKNEYIGNVHNKKILELGCGICDLLELFEDCDYVGVDIDEKYIEKAKRRYRTRDNCTFICGDLNEFSSQINDRFDMILMMGVIHHITDDEVSKCFTICKKLLKQDGIFITFDAVFVPGMSKFERFLASKDRGKYVRNADEYVSIHKKNWSKVFYECRNDTMNLPFNIIIFKDSK